MGRHAGGNDLRRCVPKVRLAQALERGDGHLHIASYFRDIGVQVGTLEDLLSACTDPGEEEIEAFHVEEGIVVFLMVDGQSAGYTR